MSSKALLDWCATTKRNEITLVAVGRPGIGKLALVANMLGMREEDVIDNHAPSTKNERITKYSMSADGVTISVFHVQCNELVGEDEVLTINKLQKKTEGRADILLYCVSILPNSKIDLADVSIIKCLTVAFGIEIWRHSILLFTYANKVKEFDANTDLKQVMNDYTQRFQSILRMFCPITVKSVFTTGKDESQSPDEIVALPVGQNPAEKLINGAGWREILYQEIIKKTKSKEMPLLFKARTPTSLFKRLCRNICAVVVICGRFGFLGLGLGTIISGILGIGGAVIGFDIVTVILSMTAYTRITIGTGVFLAIGGLVAASAAINISEYEAEQAKLRAYNRKQLKN